MPASTSLEKYLTVKVAAALLGVCPSTLRNWDRAGKLKARRHPMSHYRLYRRAELEAVLRRVARENQRDE
jgi:excisionase family DNA binding protein